MRGLRKWFTIGCLGLLAASWMSGCQSTDDDLSPQVEIAPSFIIDFLETLDTISPSLLCQVASVEEFECLNYGLLFDWSRKGNSLLLSLDDFLKPDTCVQAVAPAYEYIDWGTFEGGNYDLEINLKETVVNKGSLFISEDRYNFFFTTLDGIILKRQIYNRMPEGTFWGYVEYEDPDSDSIAQQLLSELEGLHSDYAFLPGYYGYFTIDPQTRELGLTGSNTLPFYRNFLLHLEHAAFSSLEDLLEEYRNLHGSAIQIRVFTYWGGEL
jgi:hypothetical protein